MKIYLEAPCPKCQRQLRIPTEYFGKRLSCKYCGHIFQPQAKDVPAAAAAGATNQHVEQLRAELNARTAEHANALKDAQWARAEAERLQEQMQTLALAAEKVDARHRQEIETREETLAKFAAEVEQLRDSTREVDDTKSQPAADECARLQSELDGLQRQFTEEQTALQRAAEAARSEAAALRQEHADVLQLLQAAKSECERLASAHGELLATHSDAKQDFEVELARLTAQLDIHRQGHAELTEKLHGVHGERTSLEGALQVARGELETRATEAGRLQEQMQGVQAAAEAAELKYREDNCERQRALAAVRREVLELRARAELIPVHERENEQLVGENASLSAELEAAQHEIQALRQAAELAQTQQFEEDERRHKMLASMRAEVARLLTDVKALEERAQQAQLLEARLQDAWTVTTRLEGELALANAARKDLVDRLAAAEAQAQQLQALRSERDQLADHIKALQADLAQAPGQEGASFKNAIEAAFAEVVRPKSEAPTNEKVARGLAGPNNSAMANEVARLKQENAQLRQWLAQCGVLPM